MIGRTSMSKSVKWEGDWISGGRLFWENGCSNWKRTSADSSLTLSRNLQPV